MDQLGISPEMLQNNGFILNMNRSSNNDETYNYDEHENENENDHDIDNDDYDADSYDVSNLTFSEEENVSINNVIFPHYL